MVARRLLVVGGLVGVILALLGCTGHWFSLPDTPKLVIGEVAVSGGTGELLVFASSMPEPGLGGIAILHGGLSYNPAMISNVRVIGLSGFDVLLGEFTAGDGVLVAVNPHAGTESSAIFKLAFDADPGTSIADFSFDPAHFQLSDAANQPIPNFDLEVNAKPYHIGGAE